MTNERLKSPRARLFVALELPAGARTALREWQRDLDGRAPGELRPVATDALHLTLAFIGYRPERDIDTVASAMTSSISANRPVGFCFGESLHPKPAGRPKLYAAELIDVADLKELRSELAAALTQARVFKDERREFWPHVTLARVKRSATHHRAPHPLPGAPSALTSTRWQAPAVTLFRSHLEPAGARYETIERVELATASASS